MTTPIAPREREIGKCPGCGHELTCPCKHCQARYPSEKPWKPIYEGEAMECGNCGAALDPEGLLLESKP